MHACVRYLMDLLHVLNTKVTHNDDFEVKFWVLKSKSIQIDIVLSLLQRCK